MRTEQCDRRSAQSPEPSPRADDEREVKPGFLEAAKCLAVGLRVGASAIPICFVGAVFFFMLRDLGIFLLLVLIPIGAVYAWWVTRKYLAHEVNEHRAAVAFAARYFFVGSALGFILTLCASDVAFNTFFGGWIGAFVGGLGGALQGRLDRQRRASG